MQRCFRRPAWFRSLRGMTELVRLGIVDMGSNAIRMMVVEVAPGRTVPAVLDSQRLPVRLGRDVFHGGKIPEPTVRAVVDAFRRFRAGCDRAGVKHIRAVATSAMRDARNRDVVIDQVREASGIEIEVISGTEEAYLLGLGVQSRVDLREGRSLLVDVGGGSVEVLLVEKGQVVNASSYRLGALRMLQAFSASANNGEGFVELMQRHLRSLEQRIVGRFGDGRIDRYVATGGNIDSLADLLATRGAVRRSEGTDCVLLEDLRRECADLALLSYAERMEKKGLKPDRADTILPAGLVYQRLGEIAGVDRILVPRVGIKEGLLKELVDGHLGSFSAADHVDTVLSACRAMGHKYHFEAAHAEAVMGLARQVFDQTHELHGLDARARVLLDAASLLHDIGTTVNNAGHHKHSHYLIRSSEIVGLTGEEQEIVALLARYHRKAAPSREHEDFAGLRRKERLVVERLAAILRVADALDRQHAGVVHSVNLRVKEDVVELKPVLAEGQTSRLTLEKRAVEEKGELFLQVFGKAPKLLSP